MAAKEGNKYWEFREKHGRDYKYTPDKLWEEAVMYFRWIEANPLWESVVVAKGIKKTDKDGKEITEHLLSVPKMRAMTITGFQLFADICHVTWANYKKNEDFITVITRIDDLVYSQKFEGAAATLLNPNIIARDLGLKDEQKTTQVNYIASVTKEEAKKISESLEDEC